MFFFYSLPEQFFFSFNLRDWKCTKWNRELNGQRWRHHRSKSMVMTSQFVNLSKSNGSTLDSLIPHIIINAFLMQSWISFHSSLPCQKIRMLNNWPTRVGTSSRLFVHIYIILLTVKIKVLIHMSFGTSIKKRKTELLFLGQQNYQ